MIVHGTMVYRNARGIAPYFCPVYRALSACAVTGVYRARHIWYVPVERKEHVMDELTCPKCRSLYPCAPRSLSGSTDPAQDPLVALGSLLPDEAEPLHIRLTLED